MKPFLLPRLLVLALIFTTVGCQKATPPPDQAVFFQAVEDNVHALEKKDVDAFMATIHPQSPSFESTRDIVGQMFQAVDLKYTLSDVKLLSASDDEARVSFVQKTEKTSSRGGFQDNIVQGIHILRPDHGKWKIFRTLNVNVTGLDGKPLPPPSPVEDAEPPPAKAEPPPPPASPVPVEPALPAGQPAR